MKYVTDPAAIYRQSWAILEREVDLSYFPDDGARDVVRRMVHACGMPDITSDIRVSDEFVGFAGQALASGAPILCDGQMTASGIKGRLSQNRVFGPNYGEETARKARVAETTQAAVVVESWRPRLKGSVVVIGNAPTALFRLLEIIDESAGTLNPAAVIGLPVGFVGAAESKLALTNNQHQLQFITLLGRRGGSAMAAAAINALLIRAGNSADSQESGLGS